MNDYFNEVDFDGSLSPAPEPQEDLSLSNLSRSPPSDLSGTRELNTSTTFESSQDASETPLTVLKATLTLVNNHSVREDSLKLRRLKLLRRKTERMKKALMKKINTGI